MDAFDWLETSDNFEGGDTMSPESVAEFLRTVDCYVMGSRTYETAASPFPTNLARTPVEFDRRNWSLRKSQDINGLGNGSPHWTNSATGSSAKRRERSGLLNADRSHGRFPAESITVAHMSSDR